MSQELQFETAEAAAPARCASCSQPFGHEYYEVNGNTLCGTCAAGLEKIVAGEGSKLGRFFRAILFGIVGAAMGSAVYYAVLAFTGYEVGLISILVGILAGKGVRKGTYGRGGMKYQFIAAILTYLAIVTTYIPGIVTEMRQYADGTHPDMELQQKLLEGVQSPAAAATSAPEAAPEEGAAAADETQPTAEEAAAVVKVLNSDDPVQKWVGRVVFGVVVFGIAIAAPFLAGFDNILGLLIIGFGVWQAWAINKRVKVNISGPHPIAGRVPETAVDG